MIKIFAFSNEIKSKCGLVSFVLQLTGTALSAAKRMQFSLEVKPIPQVEMMKNMPEVVLPMFWVEESIYLDKDMTDNLKNSMFL